MAMERVLSALSSLDPNEEVTLRRASSLMGIPYPTISRYREKGFIRAIRKGGHWSIRIAELQRYAEFGNYSASSDPELLTPEVTPVKPLDVVSFPEGISLHRNNLEQLERLGYESVQPKTRGGSDDDD